ncbi:transcription initiation Spt4 [Neoconidiobolus thromboides FSU 785]|nr:transcription initiation Spt4 [Neoconidiobolus thromboides FSU 785]
MNYSVIPEDFRTLRACLLCSLVKSAHLFKANGCENCEEILRMKRKANRVNECTTNNFKGMIAALRPQNSWACRFQHIDSFQPGLYALQVFGRIPDDVEDELESRGIPYIPRDGSVNRIYEDQDEGYN